MDNRIVLRLLGPVEVRAPGGWSSPGRPQQRLALAVLALAAGKVVPLDELIDAVWDARPPHSVRASVQALMSRLRDMLAGIPGGDVERRGDGYRLLLEADRVDVHRFRSLAGSARDVPDVQASLTAFGQALAVWRGPALADLPPTAWVEATRSRLASEQLAAAQDRAARLLATGAEREAATELSALLASHPHAERLALLFMVALCRCGQRADALRVFREIRARLAGDLGVEPGPELQRLHRGVLAGEPDLAVLAPPGPARARPDPIGPRSAGPRSAGQVSAGPDPAGPAGAGPGPPAVPRQLPAPPAHFTGRATELAALSKLAGRDGGRRGQAGEPGDVVPAAVVAICGTAGAGKTALALRWAHQVAAGFPDGQLYADLGGFGPATEGVAPADAIRGFLQALGAAPAQIPDSLPARAGLYRSLLAGRRMLVVLDNARDAAQVRPLLPGDGGCPVLITSRTQLTGLAAADGARLLSLGPLPGADARQLLIARLGAARVMARPDAADELVRLCAGLPLALTIAAAVVTATGIRLEALAAGLRDGHPRLDLLTTGDPASSLREVFSWSVQRVSGTAAEMFGALGVHPGPEISLAAAASLAGTGIRQARPALSELTRASLLTERVTDRFCCHGLLRAYAAERARDGPGHDAALRRMLDHYLHTANAANRLVYPVRDPLPLPGPERGTVVGELSDRRQALAWLGTERQVLLAAAAQAAAAGLDAHAWQLPAALTEFLNRQGYWHDLAASHHIALTAARRLADACGQAHAHLGLGIACLQLGRRADAFAHTERAIELFGQAGDRSRQARSRIALGAALASEGRLVQALRQTGQALRLYAQLGHRGGQAHALSNLGLIAAELGHCPAALRYCRAALGLHGELGNRLGEAHTWGHLGYARHLLGDHAGASACYHRALGLLREVTDPPEEAVVLRRLADTESAAGNRESARRARQRALAILDELPAC